MSIETTVSKLKTVPSRALFVTVATGVILAAGGSLAAGKPIATASHPVRVSAVGQLNLKNLAAGISNGGGGAPGGVGVAGAAPGAVGPQTAAPAHEIRTVPFLRYRPLPTHPGAKPTLATLGVHEARTAASPAAAAVTTSGFRGLDHYDQRVRADAGNQFSLEPPDQALAVGNGKIVEVVNNALMVYDTTGAPLIAGPVSTNKFFLQFSEYNRKTGEYGASLSDPRAFYDASHGHFYVVEWATLNDTTGAPLNISVEFVAVSQTNDPTGNWYVYNFETTNYDTPGCPCFPDFQQLGVDANGVYITHNLFSLYDSSYAGASIYALQKSGLETGGAYVVEFPVQTNDFTVHPTVVPAGGSFATEDNGTEYLVETLSDLTSDGTATGVNIWAISNTNTLQGSTPSINLSNVTVPTQLYNTLIVPAVQKDNPNLRPLGGAKGLNDPAPMLDPDDGRVSSAPVYLNGNIWTAVSTGVTRKDSSTADGIAWFQFATSGGADALTASVTSQGIIAPGTAENYLYPEVAVTPSGAGAIGFTLVGTTHYPSTAIVSMPIYANPTVLITGAGVLPDDGFTAYSQYGGNGVGRWGDYGAAAVDENGAMWFGNEFIPQVNKIYPRSSLANWGTYITKVGP